MKTITAQLKKAQHCFNCQHSIGTTFSGKVLLRMFFYRCTKCSAVLMSMSWKPVKGLPRTAREILSEQIALCMARFLYATDSEERTFWNEQLIDYAKQMKGGEANG